MDEPVDDILAHFGTKGMRWGIRKDDSGGTSSSKPQTVEEAARAEAYKSQARSHGVSTLSNDQLRELTQRLELESKYSKWAKNNPTMKEKATAFVLNELKLEAMRRVGINDKGGHLRLISEAVNGARPKSSPKKQIAKPIKPIKVNKRKTKKAQNPGVYNVSTL